MLPHMVHLCGCERRDDPQGLPWISAGQLTAAARPPPPPRGLREAGRAAERPVAAAERKHTWTEVWGPTFSVAKLA